VYFLGMATRDGPVHVVTTSRTYKGRVYTTHLLRRSYREGASVKNETVGNLSHLPNDLIEMIRRTLKGEVFVSAEDRFEIVASAAHGHVQAVRLAMQRLGFESLLSSKSSRERDLVAAMVAARIVAPHTKLATTRWWHTSTLADDFGVADANENELYQAMDWLLLRQGDIEKKLAARHLDEHSLVLYDLTSSYFEGTTCPLARLGHNRDGKKGKLQVNYGLVTNRSGCPVAVSVFDGSTSDSASLMPQVNQLKHSFGIRRLVLVGDRGMLSQKSIDALKDIAGLSWITALKTGQIRTLVAEGHVQLGLFDERNLFELAHPDFPGERLVACRNADLGRLRAYKRQSLLDATGRELDKVCRMVTAGRLRGKDRIGVRVGRVVNKYKVAKHFQLDIHNDRFTYQLRQDQIAAEAALDGIYVVRTAVPKDELSAEDTVRSYKKLSNVERAFRSLKTVDLKVRPIHHRLEDRVRSHIFLCMLAYYVEWHMRETWRSVLFADEDQLAKETRDPVAPATRSDEAKRKVQTHTLADGTQAHSFTTLIDSLATIVRNTCRAPGAGPDAPTFRIVTMANAEQKRALDLLRNIAV
jgi:hypothetical protein